MSGAFAQALRVARGGGVLASTALVGAGVAELRSSPALGAVWLVVGLASGVACSVSLGRLRAHAASEAARLAQAEQSLAAAQRANAEAERTRHLASLGEVSAVLAHEIRNPIAAVKGHAQLLVELARDDEKVLSKAKRIESEVLRLERLTDDLLVFARSGKLRTRSVDLRPLVTQAAATVGAAIEVDLPDEPVSAEVDAGRLLQVLENLARNAVRHGRPPFRFTLAAEPSSVVVVLRDHGDGIPGDRLERIFEPFVTDATRGTGLGLAVVRRVVDMHGGEVRASNHPEGGALFTVRLPASGGSRGGAERGADPGSR